LPSPEVTENTSIFKDIIAGRRGKFCVAAKNLSTGEEILHHPNELCSTASTFKVPVLIELMHRWQDDPGLLDRMYTLTNDDISPGSGVLRELSPGLTLSIKDLATLMIIRSDNTATDILVGMLGADKITANMRRLGFNDTYVTMGCKGLIGYLRGVRKNWPTPEECRQIMAAPWDAPVDDNAMTLLGVPENDSMSAMDAINIFERLHKRTLQGEAADTMAMSILLRQQINERIPGLLPKGTIVAHKTGSLARRILNDIGIVYPQNGSPYTIAIFTDQLDPQGDSQLLAQISLRIYEYFQRK
jgi:beta-lactamase class A